MVPKQSVCIVFAFCWQVIAAGLIGITKSLHVNLRCLFAGHLVEGSWPAH